MPSLPKAGEVAEVAESDQVGRFSRLQHFYKISLAAAHDSK